MAGQAAPKLIRQQRHQFAAEQVAQGVPFSTIVSRVSLQWGCSRRQARNVVNKALAEVMGDLETVDVKALMSDTIHRLQRIAMRAEQCEQYSAAVGAIRALHEFCIEPHSRSAQGHPHGRSRHHA